MSKIYIARQSIFNINGKLFGHELFFRDHDGGMHFFPSDLSATARVLLNITNHMNLETIRGGIDNRLFINVNHAVIHSGILEMLDPQKFVIELLETTEVDEKLITRVKRLKQMGFMLALDDFDCSLEMIERFKRVFGLLDIVKIDILISDPARMSALVKKFKTMHLTLLAEKIETKEQYLAHSRMGFDLFQGYYFHRPETIEGVMNHHTEAYDLIHLIQLIKADEDTKTIELFFRTKPDLSYNLIKYLNVSHVATRNEIYSIEHAIALVGRRQLLKWLLLYLYSEHHASELPEQILKTAIARAEKMETLVQGEHSKMAYLTGMYSLLDVLFDMEMGEILKHVQLDRSITQALLNGKGVLGESLNTIKQEESLNLKRILMENFEKIPKEEILKLMEKCNILEAKSRS